MFPQVTLQRASLIYQCTWKVTEPSWGVPQEGGRADPLLDLHFLRCAKLSFATSRMRYVGFYFRGWRQPSTTLWAVFARRLPRTGRSRSANRPSQRFRRWRSDSAVWSPGPRACVQTPQRLPLPGRNGWVGAVLHLPTDRYHWTLPVTVLFSAVRVGYFIERTIFFYYTNTGALTPLLYCVLNCLEP